MSNLEKKFQEDTELAWDRKHRAKINYNIGKYEISVLKGKAQFADLESAKEMASAIKKQTLKNLPTYLLEFEKNATAKGTTILWAETAEQALEEIDAILAPHRVGYIVKSKSMITEEIELNEHLEKKGIEVIETDLGEYIVQLAGEKPYHIITPIMHKSKEEVAELFEEKFGLPPYSTPEEVMGFVREKLRYKFFNAKVGITGANFLIAETGSITLTENEGNANLCVSYPEIHIVIAGIEKIIPKLEHLELFQSLLAAHGTGQNLTCYNNLVTGGQQEGEIDGIKKMYVILLDNGRTNLLAEEDHWEALKCIKCGACLNVCPVYKNIGGYTYNTTYQGPIGAVITPHLKGMKEYGHLSYASTLCGRCTEVCPVKIDLQKLLLLNRKKFVERNPPSILEKSTLRIAKSFLENGTYATKIPAFAKKIGYWLFAANRWQNKRSSLK